MSTNVLEEAEKVLVGLDTDKLVSLYADEFLFEGTAAKERITAKDQLKPYFDRLFSLPGVSFSNVSLFAQGDRGAGAWTWSGKSRRSVLFHTRGAAVHSG